MLPKVLLTLLTSALVVSARPAPEKRAEATVYETCKGTKTVALTFDDGPYIYLEDISDQLTNAGVKGTFFFNGNNYDCIYDSDVVSRVQYAYNAGHMVGDHTWAHADLTTLSSAQIVDAMYRMEQAFSRILGIKPGFMRPPYGDYNDNILTIAASRNQSIAMWDQDTGDSDGATVAQSKQTYTDFVNGGGNNAVFLNHEPIQTTDQQVLPYALSLLSSHGYKMVTLAECVGISPYAAIGVPQNRDSTWTCDGTPAPGEGCSGSQCLSGTPPLSVGHSSTTTTRSSSSSTSTTSAGPAQSGVVIHPGVGASLCLTAASNANNAAVEIENCDGSTGQSWTLVGGTLNIFGNKCLDVTSGSTTNGNKMQIYTCSTGNANQQFITTGNTIQWSGKGECLDNTNGVTTPGNVAQMWTCTGGKNQVWNIVNGGSSGGSTTTTSSSTSSSSRSTSTTSTTSTTTSRSSTSSSSSRSTTSTTSTTSRSSTTTTTTTTASGPSGTVHVIHPSVAPTKCLQPASNANNAAVEIEDCNGSTGQSWTVTSTGTLVVYGNKCLDITNGSTANGNLMQIYTCNTGNANQQFTTTGGTITWSGKGECLDLTNGVTTDGNVVQMWTCTGGKNQKWVLA